MSGCYKDSQCLVEEELQTHRWALFQMVIGVGNTGVARVGFCMSNMFGAEGGGGVKRINAKPRCSMLYTMTWLICMHIAWLSAELCTP